MNRHSQSLILVLLLLTTVNHVGCQSLGSGQTASKAWWKKSEEPVPPDAPENFGEAVKLDIAWKDDVLPGPDGQLQRGVGGRVHFLDKHGKAIRVNGSLTVYGFDEHNGQATSPRPDKRFNFKDEELQTVYSQSTIGHSYSIWLPWDGQGYQRHIAVLPIFRAEDGRLLKGDHAQAVLHGPENPSPISTSQQKKQRRFEENQLVERVVYQSPQAQQDVALASGSEAESATQRVRTINVPDSANSIRTAVQQPVTPREATATLQPASPSPLAPQPTLPRYEVQPYQPGPNAGQAPTGSRSSANWDRAREQFMRMGPRKNTGVPGAH